MARPRVEHPDPERLQQRTVRVLVATQILGGAAIGVGAAVSPLLAAVIGVALTMLGLGWSMATISGAALLIAAVPSEERARTQGVADMTMGFAGGAGGTISGIVVGSVGYATLSLMGAVLAGAVLVALFMQRERHSPPSSTRTMTGPT